MKKIVLFLVALSVMISPAAAQHPAEPTASGMKKEYSLNDLYRIALSGAERIKLSEEDLFIAETGKRKAASVLFPVISAFGSYTEFSESKSAPTGASIQPDRSASWGVRLDQSLYLSGREFTAFGIAKDTIVKRRFDLETVQEEYLLLLATRYYDVLKTKKALDIAVSNVERLTKHRDASQVRLRVGEVTKTAVLRAEAELSSAQSERIKTENDLKLAKLVLARTAGIGEHYELRESPDDTGYPELQQSDSMPGSLLQRALAERPEIQASELQRKIAEDEVKYARGAYWPRLSLEGVYARKEDRPSSDFLNRESIYGGLKLSFPFFEGGLRVAEVREAEARLRQAELIHEDLKKTVAIEVQNAYLDLKTQQGVIASLEEQLVFAKDNYHAVSKQFEHGLVNSIDVMDANTLLVRAERELYNAQYNYRLALLRLRRADGTLLETTAKSSSNK